MEDTFAALIAEGWKDYPSPFPPIGVKNGISRSEQTRNISAVATTDHLVLMPLGIDTQPAMVGILNPGR